MQKMKNVKVITLSGMLLAISVILSFFKVPITQLIEIRFAFLPIAGAAMLFGPAVGGILGILSDLLGYIIRPTGPYFPGFTVSAAVSGIIFGFLFYKKEITIKRVIVAELLDTILVSMLLNNIWLSMLYGNGFVVIFMARFVKCLIMFPINTFLLLLIMKSIKKLPFQMD